MDKKIDLMKANMNSKIESKLTKTSLKNAELLTKRTNIKPKSGNVNGKENT